MKWVVLVLVASCSSSEKPPITTDPVGSSKSAEQRRATVRVDPEAGGKGFQGVWLEHADGKRFVISYRAHEYWKSFADREVVVTGACYQPFGQAIGGTHYRVETLRPLSSKRGEGPILEVGPETQMRGKLATRTFPEGTKLAGTTELLFVDDGGTRYGLMGGRSELDGVEPGTTITIKARAIVPDMTWTAQTGGPKLWIVDLVREPDDPRYADTATACP